MNNNFFLDGLVDENSKTIVEIYKTVFPSAKKFVVQNKGNEEDAEDIFQKALLQIAIRHKEQKIEIKSSFEAYLFTVCKNLWRRELNFHKKRVTNLDEVTLKGKYENDALALVEQKRHELFVEKLGEISKGCKEILTMFFSKIPYKEIVEKTEYSSVLVVKQRVFKCKKRLADLIKKDDRYHLLKEL